MWLIFYLNVYGYIWQLKTPCCQNTTTKKFNKLVGCLMIIIKKNYKSISWLPLSLNLTHLGPKKLQKGTIPCQQGSGMNVRFLPMMDLPPLKQYKGFINM